MNRTASVADLVLIFARIAEIAGTLVNVTFFTHDNFCVAIVIFMLQADEMIVKMIITIFIAM